MFYDTANLTADPAPERPDRIDCVRDAMPLVCILGVIAGVIGGVAAALCTPGEPLPLGGRLCDLALPLTLRPLLPALLGARLCDLALAAALCPA